MPQGSTGFPAFADDMELDCRALLRRARNDGRGGEFIWLLTGNL